MADELIMRYTPLKEGGAQPRAVYAAAARDGLSVIERIKVIRVLYGMSLAEANEVRYSLEGPPKGALPEVTSHQQLLALLTAELGYCACAPPGAIAVVQAFLQAAADRSDSTADPEAFARHSQAVRACLPLESAPIFAAWFVYGMEQRDFVSHNFNMLDVWITDRGRRLLDFIKRFPPPANESEK
ncbi:MAG TPA: hypothetical protein VFE47_11260 [Tepidisphaeraceae bacterium]|jgi:hypothetical protein|nr:hypothetical protein [Tepidisphaeraceae bacterium]